MRPADLVVEALVGPEQLVVLEADAKAEGRIVVSRLIEEWLDGQNRFSRPGEQTPKAHLEHRSFPTGRRNALVSRRVDRYARVLCVRWRALAR